MSRLRASGVPIVVTLHEITRDTETLGWLGIALYRRVVRDADHLIVHTEPARRAAIDILDWPAEAITLIPHLQALPPPATVGLEELRERYRLIGRRVVLAFGFIDVDKGLDDLIHAAALLPSPLRDEVTLVFAGTVRRRFGFLRLFELRDHRYLHKVRAQVEQGNLDARFVGFVEDGAVNSWFASADCCVLAYRRSEQSGVASMAYAAGTPLVTTTAGELGEVSDVPAVPPSDPARLSAAVAEVLGRPCKPRQGRVKLGADLATVARRTLSIYEQLGGSGLAADGRAATTTSALEAWGRQAPGL
jgi:glycosyltransferase involved in cell wall biosynthesis